MESGIQTARSRVEGSWERRPWGWIMGDRPDYHVCPSRNFKLTGADYITLVTAEMTGSLCGNLVLKMKKF